MPEDINQEEKKPELNADLYDMLKPGPAGYVPLPTTVPYSDPKGSTFVANLRDSTSWGYFMNTESSHLVNQEPLPINEVLAKVPDDLIDYADKFMMDATDEDFKSTESKLRTELNDKALFNAFPKTSLATGFAAQLLDPVNIFMPGSVLLKSVEREAGLLKTMAGVGVAAAAASGVQEAILHQNQLARTAQESAFNVVSSGIVGGLLGGAISKAVNSRAAAKELLEVSDRAKKEINDTLIDEPKALKENGTLKDNDLANMPAPFRKLMVLGPMNQLINSPFKTSKFFSATMYENNYTLNRHLDLDTEGSSIERLIRQDKKVHEAVLVDYQNIYMKMNGVEGGVFKGTRAKMGDPVMNFDTFDEAVSHVLTSGVKHEVAHVNQAADLLRNKIFDPIKNELIRTGNLPADVSVENAFNYFMIVYNKDKIREQGGRSARGIGTFPQAMFDGFKAVQEKIKSFKDSPNFRKLTGDIEEITNNLDKEKLENKRRKLDAEPDKKKIKESAKIIKDLKEKLKEANLLFKSAAPVGGIDSKGKLRSIVDDPTLWGNVESTVDQIMGHKDGEFLNPILSRLGGTSGKPIKARKISIEQLDLRDWHIKSASRVAELYSRATLPVVHMAEAARRFGAKDLSELRTKIASDLLEEFNAANEGLTGKAAADLAKQLKKDQKNILDSFDIVTGVYGSGPNTLSNGAAKYYNNFLKWNALRLLGFMTVSSIPDIGMHVMQGSYKHIHHGLVKVFDGMKNISKQDMRAIGYAMESETGSRLKAFSDHDNLTIQPGVFSKGFEQLEKGFGNATLMNQWNTLQQNIAGTVSIHRTLETIANVIEGKAAPKKDQVRLAKFGISLDDYKTIYKFTKDNIDPKTGTRFGDWGNWDIKTSADARALKQFQAAVGQEIDTIVIVPSLGDKPKIGHTPLGKFVFQFKSFLMSATNKVLFSGVQRRDDINVWLGAVSMIAMGAVSYVTSSYLKGKEPDLSIGNLAHESIDRSGLLGIFMEVANIGEKALHLNGVSRYQSRNIVGAAAGPTFGAASEIAQVIGSISDAVQGKADITTQDTKKLKRLFPYQNLFYLDKITNDIFKKLSISLGATESLRD